MFRSDFSMPSNPFDGDICCNDFGEFFSILPLRRAIPLKREVVGKIDRVDDCLTAKVRPLAEYDGPPMRRPKGLKLWWPSKVVQGIWAIKCLNVPATKGDA
jgi:hypothetical protein